MKNIFSISIIILLTLLTVSAAESAFEDMELGARALGMGSAFVAVADDASAIFWNPSGIARIDDRELTMSYMELYDLVSYSSVGYAQRMKIGAIGLGLTSSSDLEGIYRELIIALPIAGEIHRKLKVGVNPEYLSSAASVNNMSVGKGRGVSVDLGCQYQPLGDLLSLGLTLQNLLSYVIYNRETVGDIQGERYSQSSDISYRIGASINPGLLLEKAQGTVLAAEISNGDLHLGVEYVFRNIAAVRAGLRTGNALNRAVSVGFGLKLPAIRLDYAYIGSEFGAQTSQFSVSIDW
jgi:hypothetical protein